MSIPPPVAAPVGEWACWLTLAEFVAVSEITSCCVDVSGGRRG